MDHSYRTIFRNMTAFGGVQLVCILLNLIKGKFVAMLLGPSGMGISSLLTSSINTVQQIATLGIDRASVREIARVEEDNKEKSLVTAIVLRLIRICAIAGAMLCLLLSPLLSKLAFGGYHHTLSFAILSIAVAFAVAGSGYLSVLQGMGMVARLSKASLTGAIAGLTVSVPLYYFFGTDGIVPSILALTICIFLFYYISYRKSVDIKPVSTSLSGNRKLIRDIISLGILLMGATFAATLTQYAVYIMVRAIGSTDDVGLFHAATTITTQCSAVVFSALAMDYYPRLSSLGEDNNAMRGAVCRQSEIVMLVVTPLAGALIMFAPLVIRLLLTDEFLPVTSLMRWMGAGIILQSILFPVDYMFLARGNRKVYFWIEIIFSNILWIGCSWLFYTLFSLEGLGISFAVRNLIYLFISLTLSRHYYYFRYHSKTVMCISVSTLFTVCAFLSSIIEGNASWIIQSSVIIISLVYSICTLRKKFAEVS